MRAYCDIFERTEQKYQMTASACQFLLDAAGNRIVPDEYPTAQVRSLYYDTPQFDLIEKSLTRPIFKEKLRLRSYGCPDGTDPVFIELKKKYKGIVYKRRVALSYRAACAYLGDMPYRQACLSYPLANEEAQAQSIDERSLLIAREIDVFRRRYAPLRPSMLITCERQAFVSTDGADIRLTFDHGIEYDAAANELVAGQGERLIGNGEVIMEAKCIKALPLWFTEVLTRLKVYPSSFSKYGNAYRAAREAVPVQKIASLHTVDTLWKSEAACVRLPVVERSVGCA